MPKLRKMRRKQKFQYDVNRRRLNQKSKKLPRIQCGAIREAWDNRLSVPENLKSMGLVADPNAEPGFVIPSGKRQMMPLDMIKKLKENETQPQQQPSKNKTRIASQLENEAKEGFKSKKSIAHPLPKEMYKKLVRYLDLYGEDYERMVRDYRNVNQETSKQLKAQVTRLKGIPQQWIPYLKSRGLIPTPSLPEESQLQDQDQEEIVITPKSQS